MLIAERPVEIRHDTAGGVGFRRIDEEIVLVERTYVGIRDRIIGQIFQGDWRKPRRRDHVARERISQVLEVRGRQRLRSIVAGIRHRRIGIVDRNDVARLVDGLGEIAGTFRRDGNGLQQCARDVLADAFVGHREEGGLVVAQKVRNHQRPSDVETELVAMQQRVLFTVLFNLVGVARGRYCGNFRHAAVVYGLCRFAGKGRGRAFAADTLLVG